MHTTNLLNLMICLLTKYLKSKQFIHTKKIEKSITEVHSRLKMTTLLHKINVLLIIDKIITHH